MSDTRGAIRPGLSLAYRVRAGSEGGGPGLLIAVIVGPGAAEAALFERSLIPMGYTRVSRVYGSETPSRRLGLTRPSSPKKRLNGWLVLARNMRLCCAHSVPSVMKKNC